jgi:hypothetical protein
MDKPKKLAVVYDSSYLMGDFQSIKKFIMARRISSLEKQGLLGFMKAKQTDYHDPKNLFDVEEVVPNEVIRKLDEQEAIGPQRAVVELLQGGAIRVDLAMDSVVGMAAPSSEAISVGLYAERLVSFATRQQFELAIVATEDEELLEKLNEMISRGKAVFGIKGEDLARTRLLHDKLAEVANRGRVNQVVVEN